MSAVLDTALEVRGVHKAFGGVQVLSDVSFKVAHGQIASIVGPSGQGKTTLLRLISGFDQPDAGEILLDGVCVSSPSQFVSPERRGIGYVPQDGALFPHLTIAQNIAFGLKRGSDARVAEMLELVGLKGYGSRRPDQISGGQMHRVALARALAPAPRIILMDEPFSALDAAMRNEVRDEVQAILRKTNTTAVMVTHDQAEAMSISDYVIVMLGSGIAQAGAPREVYMRPGSPEVAAFVGEANFFEGQLRNGRVHHLFGDTASDVSDGVVKVMYRPEQLLESENGVISVVESLSYFGHDGFIGVRFESGAVATVRINAEALPVVGAQIRIGASGDPVIFSS